MKKAYLLVYSDSLGTQDQIKDWLNKMPQVLLWRFDMPHSFYIVSENSADEIANALHDLSGKGRFVVSEVTDNKQGWLPSETWHLLNHKERQPEKAKSKP